MRTDFVRTTVLAFVIAMCGCTQEKLLSPGAGNTLVVHSVLDLSSRDQVVAIQIATGTQQSLQVVTNAFVLLTLPDGRRLKAIADDPSRGVLFGYHFPLDRLGFELVPGGTYELEVHVPDGRIVTGHTTIPNAMPVSLTSPEQRLRLEDDTVHIRWARVPAARGYEVAVLGLRPDIFVPTGFFADTSVDLTADSQTMGGERLFTPSLMHKVAVSAVDSSYYDYYRRESDIFTGVGLISHLEGADGIFGSVVPIAARLLNVY